MSEETVKPATDEKIEDHLQHEIAGFTISEGLSLIARIRAAEAELAATTSAWAAAADERDQRNSELAAIRAYLGVPEDGDSIVEWLKAHAAVIRESPPEPVLRIAKHALACDARRYVGSACTCGATSKPIDGGTK